jgi:hypothetical protein
MNGFYSDNVKYLVRVVREEIKLSLDKSYGRVRTLPQCHINDKEKEREIKNNTINNNSGYFMQ